MGATKSDQRFDVIIEGFEGRTPEEAAQAIAEQFGVDPEFAEKFTRSYPSIIRKKASRVAAEAYKSSLVKIGAAVRIAEAGTFDADGGESAQPPAAEPSTPQQSAPAAESQPVSAGERPQSSPSNEKSTSGIHRRAGLSGDHPALRAMDPASRLAPVRYETGEHMVVEDASGRYRAVKKRKKRARSTTGEKPAVDADTPRPDDSGAAGQPAGKSTADAVAPPGSEQLAGPATDDATPPAGSEQLAAIRRSSELPGAGGDRVSPARAARERAAATRSAAFDTGATVPISSGDTSTLHEEDIELDGERDEEASQPEGSFAVDSEPVLPDLSFGEPDDTFDDAFVERAASDPTTDEDGSNERGYAASDAPPSLKDLASASDSTPTAAAGGEATDSAEWQPPPLADLGPIADTGFDDGDDGEPEESIVEGQPIDDAPFSSVDEDDAFLLDELVEEEEKGGASDASGDRPGSPPSLATASLGESPTSKEPGELGAPLDYGSADDPSELFGPAPDAEPSFRQRTPTGGKPAVSGDTSGSVPNAATESPSQGIGSTNEPTTDAAKKTAAKKSGRDARGVPEWLKGSRAEEVLSLSGDVPAVDTEQEQGKSTVERDAGSLELAFDPFSEREKRSGQFESIEPLGPGDSGSARAARDSGARASVGSGAHHTTGSHASASGGGRRSARTVAIYTVVAAVALAVVAAAIVGGRWLTETMEVNSRTSNLATAALDRYVPSTGRSVIDQSLRLASWEKQSFELSVPASTCATAVVASEPAECNIAGGLARGESIVAPFRQQEGHVVSYLCAETDQDLAVRVENHSDLACAARVIAVINTGTEDTLVERRLAMHARAADASAREYRPAVDQPMRRRRVVREVLRVSDPGCYLLVAESERSTQMSIAIQTGADEVAGEASGVYQVSVPFCLTGAENISAQIQLRGEGERLAYQLFQTVQP